MSTQECGLELKDAREGETGEREREIGEAHELDEMSSDNSEHVGLQA